MAESSENGWWSSWIQTAKEKSVNALDFVKKDLVEFQTTMKSDTTKIATDVKEKITSENALAATQKAKAGVSTIFGGITKALIVEAEDKPTKKINIHPSRQIFDRTKARVNAIQVDPDTYTAEPSGPKEEFEKWLKTFNLDEQKGDISELLVVHVDVRALYTQLVPSEVSHADFWRRYFYKMHQLEQDEKRKAALMKRADDVQEEVGWDDEDDWGDLEGPSSPPRQSEMHLAAKSLSQPEQSENPEPKTTISPETVPQVPEEHAQKTMTDENDLTTEPVHDQVVKVEETVPKSCKMDSTTDEHSKVTGVTPKLCELKLDSSACRSTESSSSISSLTDSLKPMESSADTLTMVSPLEEVPTGDKPTTEGESQKVLENSDTSQGENQKFLEHSSILQGGFQKLPENVGNSAGNSSEKGVVDCEEVPVVDVTSEDDASVEVIESSSEEEIKTKVKGDLVVVGSGVSSDSTTPASSGSSNKETEDDWEREFEVSEEDLKSIQTKTTASITETNDEQMEDDWESWD